MKNKNEFLEKLAVLCKKYNATFYYTNDDDGIHIDLKDQTVFIGHLHFDVAKQLRQAKDRIAESVIQKNFGYAEVYLSSRQAAEIINIPLQTLANWRFMGEGPPYIKTGRRLVRYKYTDLISWLNRRRVMPADKQR